MADSVIRVAVVGSGLWSGHYLAACRSHPRAVAAAVCNPNLDSARRAAARHGVETVLGSVEELVARDDIDAVAVVTPNDSHARIATAALDAGKHVLCEKPMALNLAEARIMADAADRAGLTTGINFTWRSPAAARYARHLVEDGEIGRIFHVSGCFLQGFLVNPDVPLIWRLKKDKTGTGTLGDIGSHIIDLAEWITGERIASLIADTQTFIDERPLPGGDGRGRVDVDDAAGLLTRFEGGAMGNFLSTRYAIGEGMDQRLEIYGDKGSLVMSFQDQSHVRASIGRFAREGQVLDLPVPARFRTTPDGYLQQHVVSFIDAIVEGRQMTPSFAEGLRNQMLLEGAEISARERRWVDLEELADER